MPPAMGRPKQANTFVPRRGGGPVLLKTETIHDFDGGWNVLTYDLNLTLKSAKLLRNAYRSQDGTVAVRWGTRLFVDLKLLGSGRIIGMEYFNNFIISVDENGVVYKTDGTGAPTVIFNRTLGLTLPSAPGGWGATTFVCFCASNGNLVICNGSDKPLVVDSSLSVTYLQDRGTGSNAWVPRAKYCRQQGNYLILAGDPSNPSTLYIGAANTTGTFAGAPAPNDGVNIDLGPKVPTGDKAIKGLGRFRDKLLVNFAETSIIVTLGTYNAAGTAHVPGFDEAMDQYGAVSHRTVQTFDDNLFFTDAVGVATVSRSLFNTTLKPERMSQIIDPEIQKSIQALSTSALEERVFSVQNRLEGQYMLFVPDHSSATYTTETRCFVFTYIKQLKVQHWAEFRGWNWQSACRSAGHRVFFSRGTQIFVLGNQNDPIYADYVGDQETWSDDTAFSDGTGWGTDSAQLDSGIPIDFDWQMPWTSLRVRFNTKTTKYIGVDTLGDGSFTLEAFVDNFLTDPNDFGELFTDGTGYSDGFGNTSPNPVYVPLLQMDFAGGDRLGFGADYFGNDFGGGRPSRDERLYAWPMKCKIFKLRLRGSTRKQLKISSITFGYLAGSIRR
jgi:hypothetical protein